MSGIRASPTGLKDKDDDYSFYLLKTDVERLAQAVRRAGISVSGGADATTTNDDSSDSTGAELGDYINAVSSVSAGASGAYTTVTGYTGVTSTGGMASTLNVTTGILTIPTTGVYAFSFRVLLEAVDGTIGTYGQVAVGALIKSTALASTIAVDLCDYQEPSAPSPVLGAREIHRWVSPMGVRHLLAGDQIYAQTYLYGAVSRSQTDMNLTVTRIA